MPPLDVSPARADELDALLPLLAGYQRFYGSEHPDDDANRAFFGRFVAPSDSGLLIAARDGAAYVGFANLYWTFSSIAPGTAAVMNDLFVAPDARGGGIGMALIEASANAARERGMMTMSWMTALDNRDAQRVYERTGAQRSAWFEYELTL